MKTQLERIALWVTEAAISGSFLIPLLIFFESFSAHQGQLTYILPFALFYAFNKTGDFILEAFGTARNAYRLALIGLGLAIAGCLLSLLGDFTIFAFDLGASLAGLGTSIFSPMYRFLKGKVRGSGGWRYGKVEIAGGVAAMPLVLVLALSNGAIETPAFIAYAAMLAIAAASIRGLDLPVDECKEPLFSPAKIRWVKFIPAALLFTTVFFVRVFKQTANASDMALAIAAVSVIALLTAFQIKDARLTHVFSYRVFFSEVMVFAILFDVVVYVARADYIMLMVAMEMLLLGSLLTTIFGAKIVSKLSKYDVPALMAAAELLATIPFMFEATNPLGMLLIAFSATLGMSALVAKHKKENAAPATSPSLSAQNVSAVGSILGQTILFLAIAVVSTIVFHNADDLMSAYVYHISRTHLDAAFHIVQLACLAIFWVQGILLLIIKRKGRKPAGA